MKTGGRDGKREKGKERKDERERERERESCLVVTEKEEVISTYNTHGQCKEEKREVVLSTDNTHGQCKEEVSSTKHRQHTRAM